MPDDTKRRGPEDPTRINLSQEHEVKYWCSEFGCTKKQLKDAVDAVGSSVRKVKKYLGID